jgi:hypothetical protein
MRCWWRPAPCRRRGLLLLAACRTQNRARLLIDRHRDRPPDGDGSGAGLRRAGAPGPPRRVNSGDRAAEDRGRCETSHHGALPGGTIHLCWPALSWISAGRDTGSTAVTVRGPPIERLHAQRPLDDLGSERREGIDDLASNVQTVAAPMATRVAPEPDPGDAPNSAITAVSTELT